MDNIYHIDFLKRNPIYTTWLAMRQRCSNHNHVGFKRYGGRGITICEEWNDYKKFEQWMFSSGWRKGLTIDRIDNNKGYNPANCQVITKSMNSSKDSGIPVFQYDKYGELISTYKSLVAASRTLKIDAKSIGMACVGKSCTCKGYLWSHEVMSFANHAKCKYCGLLLFTRNKIGICRECQRHPSRRKLFVRDCL